MPTASKSKKTTSKSSTAKEPKTTSSKKKESASTPRVRIKVLAFDHRIVDNATRQIVDTATRTGAIVAGPIPLPTNQKKITVNRSTFVHKNSREQFEVNTHRRLIDIQEATPNTISSLQNLSLPSGVEVEIKMM